MNINDATAQRGMRQLIKDPETGRMIQPYEDSWAIIIGIDRYQHVPRLDYAVADARAIERILINSFGFERDNITVLTNEEATQRSIRRAFGSLYDVGPDDRVLIFFAGHGETIDLATGGNMGFLIPYEGVAHTPQDLYETSISMQTIRELAGYIPAKHVIFLIDACYGGLAAEGVRSLSRDTQGYVRKIVADRARQIITAGGRGEQVVERPEWGHSAFTYTLLNGLEKGLADLDNDGIITANELATYLRRQVSRITNNRQTPQFRAFTYDEGEFLFVRPDVISLDLERETTISDLLHPADNEEQSGNLYLSSIPPGARIKLNGKLLPEITPTEINKIRIGEYTVEIHRGGLYAKKEFSIEGGTTTTITLNLERMAPDELDTVTDIDDNVYRTVKIGDHLWMADNLRVTRYRNGDIIPQVIENKKWGELRTGAWSNYNNDFSNDEIFGKLYNWYSVDDSRGLCPSGWRVPTNDDWDSLEYFLGGRRNARLKMASLEIKYWNRPIVNATNESGFSGMPGGNRNYNGSYNNLGNYGYWWSSSEQGKSTAWRRSLGYFTENIEKRGSFKEFGFSVRCIRDLLW